MGVSIFLIFQSNFDAKVGNQEIPGVMGKLGLGVQNEARQRLIVLPRECTGHSKYPLPITQQKTLHMDIADGQYQNQIDFIFCSQKWRSSIQSGKQDWELTVAQIMNSLLPNSDLN